MKHESGNPGSSKMKDFPIVSFFDIKQEMAHYGDLRWLVGEFMADL